MYSLNLYGSTVDEAYKIDLITEGGEDIKAQYIKLIYYPVTEEDKQKFYSKVLFLKN